MESFEPIDGGVIIVPKDHDYRYISQLRGGDVFQHHSTNDLYARKIIQQLGRNNRPTVKSGYVIPIDPNGNTMLQWSKELQIGKAYGGKGSETGLVQCLADAYADTGVKMLDIVKGIKSNLDISNREIITALGRNPGIIANIGDTEIDLRANIMTGEYSPDDLVQQIQNLAVIPETKPLLSHWLQLETKLVRENLIKVIGDSRLSMSKLDQKIMEIDIDEEIYKQTLLFELETHRQAAAREFKEETGYSIDAHELIHFYTLSEVKYTDLGNRWLKDRHYFIYLGSLGKQGKIKESLSEKSQDLKMISGISIVDAVKKQEEGIIRKLEKSKRQKKLSTAISNLMAFQELSNQIKNKKIRI